MEIIVTLDTAKEFAETLAKICVALNCNFDDIMEIVPDEN